MNGYWGKALHVNLTSKTTEILTIPEDWLEKYLGGEGIGIRYLYDFVSPELEPFDEQQALIFCTGPLTGTAAPCSGRSVLTFRSPATGTIGASNAGGHFAPKLKKTGYDVLIVTGCSQEKTYLNINNDNVEILSADNIWGKDIVQTENIIRKEIKDEKAQIVSIGRAGENKVLFAAIMTDGHRAFGRGGAGAVMGSKNLKAIAVNGNKTLPVANLDELKKCAAEARKELFEDEFIKVEMRKYGTPAFYDGIEEQSILPTRNWQRTTFKESINSLGYKALDEKLEIKKYACSGCPIACGRESKIVNSNSRWEGMHGGGLEYETLAAFGSKCEVTDIYAVAASGFLANDMGLDIISTGQAIASAMEWFEEGIIDKNQTDEIELKFGNADAVFEMVRKIAEREGFGNILADGVKRAAEKIGNNADYAAMHVKGLEMAADGVRASKGMVLSHATSPRGADHLRPYSSTVDAAGGRDNDLGIEGEIDCLEDGNKAWVKPFVELSMVHNLLGTCIFTSITLALKAPTIAKLLSAATGKKYDKDSLLLAAERVINMERMVNASYGFNRKDDTLPKRFLKEPAIDGIGKGEVVNLDKNLDSYYEAMGWKLEDGLPTDNTLKRLDLGWMN
jgi:aldehyde:ferredoxin oxidoreductase